MWNLLYAVWYTPSKQLLWRLLLKFKRNVLVVFSNIIKFKNERDKWPLCIAETPPAFILQIRPQSNVKLYGDSWHFCFLNHSRSLGRPVEWHLDKLNRGTRLWKLHLHYFDWTNSLDDKAFIELVDDWIINNRPYKKGYWLDSWNSYAISIRVVSLLAEIEFRRAKLAKEFVNNVESSVFEQLIFLSNNLELDIGGNHLIKNIKAMLWGAKYYQNSKITCLRIKALRLLQRELNTQILEDGFHFELSPAYHIQVFSDLLDCWRLIDDCPIKDKLIVILDKMSQVVADMTHPDGSVVLFNDGGLNMTYKPQDILALYSTVTGRSIPMPRSNARFDKAGYYVLRSRNIMIVYDAGNVGPDGLPAHSHGDIHSFELSLKGKRFIVDAGVYEYNPGALRDLSRSSLMHNTLTIDDKSQCDFWGSFRMGRRARVKIREALLSSKKLYIDSEHSGYSHLAGRPIHRRIINSLDSGKVHVRDEVIGGSSQAVKSRLLLHPDVHVEFDAQDTLILNRDGIRVNFLTDAVRLQVEDAVWWPDFGDERNTKIIILEYDNPPLVSNFHLKLEL